MMNFVVKIAFDAEVTEVGQKTLRFKRLGYVPDFFEEHFGKFFHEALDFGTFQPKQKIRIEITNTEPQAELLEQSKNKLIVRGVVNEKSAYGMSLRKPLPQKTTFFERTFKTFEFAEITESTRLSSSKNPYEIGDFIEVVVTAAVEPASLPPAASPLLPTPYSPKPLPIETLRRKQKSSSVLSQVKLQKAP